MMLSHPHSYDKTLLLKLPRTPQCLTSRLPHHARKDDEESSSFFCAAVITSPHGIQGHVKIKCFLEDPSDFKTYSPYCNEDGEETYKVSKVFSQEKDILIASLEGIHDRNEAESLKGAKLMLARSCLPNLSEGTFYHADLLNLQVLSSLNEVVGVVHALYNFGAGDILEIKIKHGKLIMIPFTQGIVPDVDIKKGFLRLSHAGDLLVEETFDGA